MVRTLLAAGDRYQVPSREDLVVVAGDGGLVNVEIDGVRRGTLGMPGEIVVGRPLKVSSTAGRPGLALRLAADPRYRQFHSRGNML